MIRLLGFLFLSCLHFSFASRIHGRSLGHPVQKRPASIHQSQENGQVVRLPMNRRPPRITTKATKARAGSRVANGHHPSHTTTSDVPTFTPLILNTTTYFEDSAYGIKIWIGSTSAQSVILDFDTGSSETWVSPPCTSMSDYPEFEELCRELGTYVPDQSFSAVDLNETCPSHWLMYGSGSVFIRYYKDVIQFSDPLFSWAPATGNGGYPPTLPKGAQFGLAVSAQNMPSGIFGAGYGAGFNQDYNSFIDEMYEQGLIEDKDFSVALGSIGTDDGEIIFGGVDLAKFTGPLHELEISHQFLKSDDGYYRYWVNVTSIGFTAAGSCETVPITPASFNERFLPDSGTTLTYIPESAFNILLEAFPDATETPSFGYVIDCSTRDQPGTIDFTFGDFTINVKFSDFIFLIPAGPTSGPEDVCIIGAYPSDGIYILGDTFLRSVYAIFRQQHHKIYLAKYQDCGSHVVSSHDSVIYRLHGDCVEGSKDPKDARRYGDPNDKSATPSSCHSITTGTFPPESSSTSDPFDVSTWFAHPGIPKPAIQTGDPNDMRSPLDRTPAPGPPWSGNETAVHNGTAVSGNTIGSTGHASAPSNSFPTPTLTKNETSSVLPHSTSSPSQAASSSWLTAFPEPTISSDWVSSSSGTDRAFTEKSLTTSWFTSGTAPFSESSPSFSTFWPTEPSSSWSYSFSSEPTTTSITHHHHTTTSSYSSEVSLITIPVQPDETIIVKLESTTYTVVDGTTLTGSDSSSTRSRGFTTSSESTSDDISSWSSWTSEWGPSSTDTDGFTWTTIDETSTTHSPTRTHSTKSTRKTTTQPSSSTEVDGYLTSWLWNPTGSGTEDPFYPPTSAYTESTDSEEYHHHHTKHTDTEIFTDTEVSSSGQPWTSEHPSWTSDPVWTSDPFNSWTEDPTATQSSAPDETFTPEVTSLSSTSDSITPETTPEFTTVHVKRSSSSKTAATTNYISHNDDKKDRQTSSTKKIYAVARLAAADADDKIHQAVPPDSGEGGDNSGLQSFM